MRRSAVLILAAVLLLTGCAFQQNREQKPDYYLYFLTSDVKDGQAVEGDPWYPRKGLEGEELIDQMLSDLLAGPSDPELRSPFPAGLRLLGWEQTDGRITLNFSELYESLSGVDQSLANCCLVLTLCQIEGVESVRVTVEGASSPFLPGRDLRAEDVRITGGEGEGTYVPATLWFPMKDGSGLGVECREVPLTVDGSLAQSVLSALLEGPKDGNMRSPFPPGTEIVGAVTEMDTCYVELGGTILEELPESREERELLAYSITNTLCASAAKIERVQLMTADGKLELGTGLNGPLEPNLKLESDSPAEGGQR